MLMKNKFSSFLTQKGRWLIATLFLLFSLGIGNAWGDDWTAANIVDNSGAGTTKSHITVSSPGIASTTSAQIWKDGKTAKNETTLQIGASTTSDYNKTKSYVEIKADKGYALGTTLNFRGGSNDSNDKNCVVVWWTGKVGATFTGYEVVKLNNKNISSSASANYSVTLPANTRVVRIYRQVGFNSTNTAFGTDNTLGDGKAYFASVTATSVLAPEIEGDAEMLKSETIPFVGYPAGGTWAVTSGSATINSTSGALTSGSTSGDVVISYTVDDKSGTHTVTVLDTDSKTLCWDFTQGVLPTASGVTATGNGEFNAMGYNLATANTNFAYIDVEDAGYVITAATLTVFPGGTGAKNFKGDFNASLTDAISTTDGEYWQIDRSISDSEKNTEVNLGNVSSIPSGATAFRITKGSTGVAVGKIYLTLKKAVACTVAPTVSATTKGATTSTTQVVNCAGISSLGSEGCSISSYGFVYGTGSTPNIDDDTPVEVGTSYSTINTAFAETTLTGLTASTTYYVRAYATNGSGTSYGSAVSFTTNDACTVVPTVSAISKGTTSFTTQVLNCDGITAIGSAGCAISSYGFVYGTTEHPTTANTTKEVGTSYTVVSTAFAETTLTGLTPNTTYYVRAYATNDFGTAYSSNELSFTTLETIGNVAFIASSADATNDAITALRDAGYNVTVRTKAASPDYTGVDLVVLDESLSWANSDEGATVVGVNVPILSLKAFFYTLSSRWNWGTPVNPSTSELATLSTEYTNISSHPIFDGVTITAGAVDMVNPSKSGNNLQGVTTSTLVEGKRGYTLATSATGTTCIHELTPSQRGVSTAKYLLIALSSNIKDNYSDDAKKMIVNAAKYLIGNTSWEPVVAPKLLSSVPANSATDVAVEGNIVLTFSQNVTLNDASKFTLSGGAGSLTTASISVSDAVVTIPYSGLDNSTEYTLATAAGAVKNGSDVPNAALSNIVFTTEAACTKPKAPESLAASNITHTSADLSWDPLGYGANGYKISIIKKDDETVILDWTDEATNSYEAKGLTQGTTYTLKVKYKGTGAQCEFSNEVTLDFTTTAPSVADLVTIADDYTFTPSATIAAGTLAESNKFFGAGTDDCDYGSGMRVKENRALAFKVNNGARVKVTFTTNGDREMQLGTDKADDDNKAYGHTKTSPATFDVTADGVVYLTASSDLRFSKLEIMYPHTVTYDLNGGTGTTPTQASKYVGETFSVHDGVTDITAPASKDFDKWVDQDAADVAAGATYTMPAKNVTLTAQWVDHIEPVDPTLTYDDGAYSVGGSALDLSSLITAQTSTGAITYSVKTDGGTSASIDGNNFTATAAGTATITASQAAVVGFNAKSVDFNVVVTEPTEVDGIKMVVTGALTGNFRVKADQLKTGAYTVEGINYAKYVQMGSTHTSFGGETEGTQTKGIYYAPTKKNITFWFYMQNTESSTTRKIYVYTIEEGKAITSKTVDVEAGSHLVSTDITLTTNAEIVFGVENTKLYFCQIVAVESGEDLLQGGQNGYVFDYSKKRQNVAANTLRTIDGIDYKLSAESKINSASNVQLTTLGTHYIKFHLDAPMTVNVYADNKKYYVGTECSTEDAAKTYEATGDGEFTLAAGNWYINGSGAQVKINKLSFMLPKCEKPTITTQPATCHTFAPGSMTATVVAEVIDGGTLSYQWYNASDDSEVDGATAATLTTTTEGTYYVIVTNSLAGHQDNSTKSDEAELGYRVTNDATLMALSYGTPATAITLEDGVYTYAVELAKGTTDVPALAATATMDGYATVTISNAAEFVSYAASSTVTVKSEDATVTNVYTVNFTVKHDLPQVDVTATTTWNWANAATTMQKIVPAEKDVEQLMANIDDEGKQLKNDAEFNSQALIFSGQEALEKSGSGANTRWFAKGGHIKFNVTVPGTVEVEFSDNGNNNRRIKINNAVSTVASASNTDVKTYKAYVQPGEVMLMGVKNDGTGIDQYIRISKIIFTANPTPDYTRNVTNNIGTLCVDHNVLAGGAVGATFYQIASRNEQYNDKIDFEEVLPNEELKAGEPYIFQSTTGRIDLFYGATVADDPVAVRGMIGSFVNANVDIDESNKNDILYIANNKLWNCDNLVGSHLNVVANRAYIVMSDVPTYAEYQAAQTSNPAPRRRVTLGKDAEQVATGCENVNVSDKPVKMIINGQLFILRGEKMYDAKGQLVK